MNIEQYFGTWFSQDVSQLNKTFIKSTPYPYILIEPFFSDDFASKLSKDFDLSIESKEWIIYNNPIEKKHALNKFDDLPNIQLLFDIYQSPQFISKIREITGIHNLEKDEHLHGAGLHYSPRGGKLDMHLDYSIHPITGKERRVNLIVYLNKNWKTEWGGDLQMWDVDFTKCIKKINPDWNKAILFRTNDISYHGLPHPIECPDDEGRKSIAIYYVSDKEENATQRYKAQFKSLPNQKLTEGLKKLYEIRVNRRITEEDLEKYYPNWENDINGKGFWY